MTDRSAISERASSFGAVAAQYERGRPGYPPAAVDWLLPAGEPRVLDLGAGTGKLTRQLLERDLDVVAVEPSDGMRSELRRVIPEARCLAGSAEEIPLPDGSVDVVLVAQAWHWVDVERAAPEVARVLAPGGRLGLLWNIRDEREPWVAELGRIVHTGEAWHELATSRPAVGPPFGPIERHDVEWVHRMTSAMLLDAVASRSYIITLSEAERESTLAAVLALIEGRSEIWMPYVTRCFRTEPCPG